MGIDKARRGSKKGSSGRDSGPFVALPWSVLDSHAYSLLSHPARSLLIEFARQYVRDNNGRLLASMKHLSKRKWNSSDVIQRAKKELLDAGFIYETVKGHRPNKASWYAITWQTLDKLPGYDAGALQGWVRSAYEKSSIIKNKSFTPRSGLGDDLIAPSNGVEARPTTPPNGSINGLIKTSPTPSDGNHLELPSAFEIRYG